VALLIHPVPIPVTFIQPGTYDIRQGKQRTAFGKGTIYIRHGAKSEPGNTTDLREFVDREIEKNKKSWLSNIRKVIEAPAGYPVSVFPPDVIEASAITANIIRIVDDPTAPAYRNIDSDKTYPHRQKEVVQLVNHKLSGKTKIKAYDVYCVRKVYDIDYTRPHFYYKSKFASPQYSDAFVNWLVEQYENNHLFFEEAKVRMRDKKKG